jgi:hypothetical protein
MGDSNYNLMMKNFKKNSPDIQEEWDSKGEHYAKGINEMIEFGETNGWGNWTGEDPEDKREHIAEEVIRQLKQANMDENVEHFRNIFPPAFNPIISFLEKNSQSIEQLHFIHEQKIIFLTGTAYEKRQAYLLNHDKIITLDQSIMAIGKSKRNNIFAIATENKIATFEGWDGELISEFAIGKHAKTGITELIPFNDGTKLLIVTSEGIYLTTQTEEKLIHPLTEEEEEEDWSSNIEMGNATLSNDNSYIVVGDQDCDHRILDSTGNTIGSIGAQSSYPHF